MRKSPTRSTATAFGLLGLLASLAGCSGSVQNATGCAYHGKQYAVGDTFPDSDGCNQCACGEQGQVQCTLVGCDPSPMPPVEYCTVGGTRYAVGQQVPSNDCNTCSCSVS